MKVKIPADIAQAIGERTMREFDVELKKFAWQRYTEVNIGRWSIAQVKRLRALVEPHAEVRGGKVLLKDLDMFVSAYEGGATRAKARKAEHFAELLKAALTRTPGHRVYVKNDVDGDAMLAFYVKEIKYYPERDERDHYSPPTVAMRVVYERFGGRFETQYSWTEEECVGLTVNEALTQRGVYLETVELRKQYIKEVARFHEVAKHVGGEYLASGVGVDDLDDTRRDDDNKGFWGTRQTRIDLAHDGKAARVIVDVFRETDKEGRESHVDLNMWFWKDVEATVYKSPVDAKREAELRAQAEDERKRDPNAWAKDLKDLETEDVEPERPSIEVPIHPFLACYDKGRDKRIRIHVNYLTPYVYDRGLAKKLVLPADEKRLVTMLAEHKLQYTDIVAGKSLGVVVLCKGPPGTGKTLTAEVLSEAEARPLVSIQAANLGLNAEQVAKRLGVYLKRVRRWNGILLINEADIYVAPRGSDLVQNAICGAFLETIEYAQATVFLTTNREVDDAVASRCIARIDYGVPGAALLPDVWRILSETAGLPLSKETVDAAVDEWPHLSGRDVKNLLALASVLSAVQRKPVDFEMLKFVKHFKPTADVGAPKLDEESKLTKAVERLAESLGARPVLPADRSAEAGFGMLSAAKAMPQDAERWCGHCSRFVNADKPINSVRRACCGRSW